MQKVSFDTFDPKRRRALTGGASVVLSSLLAKPVLGAVPYNCTVSGQLSGNTSSHGASQSCASLAKSPAYWISNKDAVPSVWPSGYVAGALPAAGACVPDVPDTLGTLFHGVSILGVTLDDAYRCQGGALVQSSTGGASMSLLQVLTLDALVGTQAAMLGSATVAVLFSAIISSPDFPLTPREIIVMFNAVYNNGTYAGTYEVKTGVYWSALDVTNYFKSLYS